MYSRKAMKLRRRNPALDIETQSAAAKTPVEQPGRGQEAEANLETQTSVFHWADVCYDVKVKGETRRILDHVNGWVDYGTLTALMVRIGPLPHTHPRLPSTPEQD